MKTQPKKHEPEAPPVIPESTSAPVIPESKDTTPTIKASRRKLFIIAGIVILIIFVVCAWLIIDRHKAPAKTAASSVTAVKVGALPSSSAHILKIGTIIDEDGLASDTQQFQPFLAYLVSQLHNQGITSAEFVPEKSVAVMAQLLRENRVDIYTDSIFPVYVADQLAGSQLIADRWKGGAEFYHTAIFVKKDSPITTLSDLEGHVLAFDSTTSTVGYFLPKAELLKLGYKVVHVQTTSSYVPPNEIGYAYVHAGVYGAVQNGSAAVGAESELEIRAYFGSTFDQNYRIIWTSPNVMRWAVAVRGNMNPKLRTALNTTMLDMNQTPAGRKVLQEFADTAKFTDVSPDSSTDYGEIANLTNYVENEIVQGGLGQ